MANKREFSKREKNTAKKLKSYYKSFDKTASFSKLGKEKYRKKKGS